MRIIRLSAATICCLLATSFLALGQKVYQDFIVNQQNARISGVIIRSFDFNQASSINFIDKDGKKTRYFPEDIKGFGLSNGRVFESKNLPEEEGELVFFQVIINGEVSLLSYKNRFFIENEAYFLELHHVNEAKDTEGNLVKARDREYMGRLSYLLYGPCGNELKQKIATTNLSEKELISTFSVYFKCEQKAYQLYVENLPFVRASLVPGLGVSFNQSYVTKDSFDEIPHVFDTNYRPFVSLGLKLDQWRRLPRVSFDTGIGFTSGKEVVNLELFKPNQKYSATEEFSRSGFIVPIFINYLAIRSQNNEFYLGAGTVIRSNTWKSNFSIVDYTITHEPVIVRIYEEPVLSYSSGKFSPALKLGIHFFYNRRYGMVSEFQLEHVSREYTLDLSSRQSDYNSLIASFMIGFRL